MSNQPRARRWRSLMGAMTLSALILASAALPGAAETPEAFARKVADVTKTADWKGFAALFDPDALTELKKLLRGLLAEESTRPMGKAFTGLATAEEVDKLSGEQVFERFMSTVSTNIPGFTEALKSADIQVIGHVDEKPDLAHVVTRNTVKVGEVKVTKMEVISLRKQGDSWRALLSGSLEGVVEQLRQLAKKEPAPAGGTR
jgi:hypothetical protein